MEGRFNKLNDGDESLLRKVEIPNGAIAICLEQENKSIIKREYIIYPSPFSLYRELMKTPDISRHAHEIIRGGKMQKIYIDIDMPLEDDEIGTRFYHSAEEKLLISRSIVIECMRSIIKCRSQINASDILVLNSNSEIKQSYHIIVDRWCFPSATQNKDFFYEMLENIPLPWRRYFDHQMYSSIRNFRTYMSTKNDGSRILKVDHQSTWRPDEEINDTMSLNKEIFLASLVTMVDCCKLLSFTPKDKDENVPSRDINNKEIQLMLAVFKTLPESSSFESNGMKGSSLLMKRKAPTYCPICEKTHHKQNVFLFLTFNNDVWMNCIRGTKSRKLGNIDDFESLHGDQFTCYEKKSYELPKMKELPEFQSINVKPVEISTEPDTFGFNPNIIPNLKPIIETHINYEPQLYLPIKKVSTSSDVNPATINEFQKKMLEKTALMKERMLSKACIKRPDQVLPTIRDIVL